MGLSSLAVAFAAILIISEYWLLLAEGHLTRWLLGAMVRRIEALLAPAG